MSNQTLIIRDEEQEKAARESLDLSNRRRRLAEIAATITPAMLTAVENVIGQRRVQGWGND